MPLPSKCGECRPSHHIWFVWSNLVLLASQPSTFLPGLYHQPWDAHSWFVDLQVGKCDVHWPWPHRRKIQTCKKTYPRGFEVHLIAGITGGVVSTWTPLSSSPKEGVLDYAKTESPATFPGSSILCKAQARSQTLLPCTFCLQTSYKPQSPRAWMCSGNSSYRRIL